MMSSGRVPLISRPAAAELATTKAQRWRMRTIPVQSSLALSSPVLARPCLEEHGQALVESLITGTEIPARARSSASEPVTRVVAAES